MTTLAAQWPVIHKQPDELEPRPNMPDYDAACRAFSWDTARAELDGLPDGRGLNIADPLRYPPFQPLQDHPAVELLS